MYLFMREQTNCAVIAELQAALQTHMVKICPPYSHAVHIDVKYKQGAEYYKNTNTWDEYLLLHVVF